MKQLNNIYNIIQELKNTRGTNAKKEILYGNRHNDILFKYLYYVYDPYSNYRITKVSDVILSNNVDNDIEMYNDFFHILDRLKTEISGNLAKTELAIFCNKHGPIVYNLLTLVLDRELHCGVGVKLINSVFKEKIPEFLIAKAKDFDFSDDSFKFPAIAEIKMDGVRVIADIKDNNVILKSSNGKDVYRLENLKQEILSASKNILKETKDNCIRLEGEITSKNRRSASGLFNKAMKDTITLEEENELIYTVFDVLYNDKNNNTKENIIALDRRNMLDNHFIESDKVKLVEKKLVNNKQELMDYYSIVYQSGLEGLIVKDLNSPYTVGRSKAWLKLKAVLDCDLSIVDFTEGTGKRMDLFGSIICESADKKLRVSVGSGFSDKTLEEFTKNKDKLIGSIVKIKYNGIIKSKDSDIYSLFLPRFLELRIDKNEADDIEKILSSGNIGQL